LRYEIVRPKEYITDRKFKFPTFQPKGNERKIPVNAVVGPYGGFYELG
jgi:hypothetical protein